jgi:hypothetical protein
MSELGQSGLIGSLRMPGQDFAEPSPLFMGEVVVNARPTLLAPTVVGADLARLMRLDRISRADITEVYTELGGDQRDIDWDLMPK